MLPQQFGPSAVDTPSPMLFVVPSRLPSGSLLSRRPQFGWAKKNDYHMTKAEPAKNGFGRIVIDGHGASVGVSWTYFHFV